MLSTHSPDDLQEPSIHRHIQPQICHWTSLDFGKHETKTLPQIVIADSDYFFWACEKAIFKTDPLRTEAALICQRATHIKILDAAVGTVKVLYGINSGVGKLERVWIVPVDSPEEDEGLSYRLDYFDLSVPRRLAAYDKAGSKLLMEAVKEVVFRGAKLTKPRIESFFNDPRNFACD
jgi:hypothetical protein